MATAFTNAAGEDYVPRGASLSYTNQGATRNLEVDPALVNAIVEGVTAVYGPDYSVEIFSGAQGEHGGRQSRGTTGTRRHTTGVAADVWVYDPNGRRLSESEMLPLGQHWLAEGIGGVGLSTNGAGKGTHLDLIGGKDGKHPMLPGESQFWFYGGGNSSFRKALSASLNDGVGPDYTVSLEAVRSGMIPPGGMPGDAYPAVMSDRVKGIRTGIVPPHAVPATPSNLADLRRRFDIGTGTDEQKRRLVADLAGAPYPAEPPASRMPPPPRPRPNAPAPAATASLPTIADRLGGKPPPGLTRLQAPSSTLSALETAKQKLAAARERQASRVGTFVRPEPPPVGPRPNTPIPIPDPMRADLPNGGMPASAPSAQPRAPYIPGRTLETQPVPQGPQGRGGRRGESDSSTGSVPLVAPTPARRMGSSERVARSSGSSDYIVESARLEDERNERPALKPATAPALKPIGVTGTPGYEPKYITTTKMVPNPEYTVYLGQLKANERMTPTGSVISAEQFRAINDRNYKPPKAPALPPAPPQLIPQTITILNPKYVAPGNAAALSVPGMGNALAAPNYAVPTATPTSRVAALRAEGYSPSDAYAEANRRAAEEAARRAGRTPQRSTVTEGNFGGTYFGSPSTISN